MAHPNMMQDIKDFHEKFGLEYNGPVKFLNKDLFSFRFAFMEEELMEYRSEHEIGIKAVITESQSGVEMALEESLDALVDLVYVALGTAYLHGFDFNEAWHRVHEANMAKVRAKKKSDSKRGSIHDVVKPENWIAPNHSDLVHNNIYFGDKNGTKS